MEKLGRFYVNTAGGEVVGGESDGNSLTYLGKIEKVTTNYHKFPPLAVDRHFVCWWEAFWR